VFFDIYCITKSNTIIRNFTSVHLLLLREIIPTLNFYFLVSTDAVTQEKPIIITQYTFQ